MGLCKASQLSTLSGAALASNGYWLFEGTPLLKSCDSLGNGDERINVCQPGILPACCDNPYGPPIEDAADWKAACCGADNSAFNAAVAEYWADLNQINHQLPP